MIGQTLSQFEITDKLGEGGMGAVYRARDTKLGREVAIKVLPEAFTEDAERLARFEREAQVLAALNHPNIAGIFEIGSAIPEMSSRSSEASRGSSATEESEDGRDPSAALADARSARDDTADDTAREVVHFLVMELAEGEDLAAHLGRGPIPLEAALPIALQVAQGLEIAHDRGIVHRDLKPANVMVGSDRKVKVLDFGLAKAFAQEAASGQSSLSMSPTLTAQMTQAGTLLGTAAYMSPEQARGEEADRRADIWAFGAVLMEMLTGTKVFPGKTVSDSLAGILAREPEWEALPDDLPTPIRGLLERCLEKELTERLQAIGEARISIERYLADPAAADAPAGEGDVATAAQTGSGVSRGLAAALALALAGLAVALWRPWVEPPPPAEPIRLSAELGADIGLQTFWGPSAVISPDGKTLVLDRAGPGAGTLYLRRLSHLTATELAGTEGARNPFFSPDGEWIGFFADDSLKKISIHGGAAVTLAPAGSDRGGHWAEDDHIVLAPQRDEGLFRIPAAGGTLQPLTTLDPEGVPTSHRFPQVLPGGRHVLFTVNDGTGNWEQGLLQIYDLVSGETTTIHSGGLMGRYLPSGHLVFAYEGTLFAAPLDLDRMELLSSPVPVVEDLMMTPGRGLAQFSVSADGTLVYLKGSAGGRDVVVRWMTEDGRVEPLLEKPGVYSELALSPDGERLAMQVDEGGSADIWTYDWARDTMTRMTFSDADEQDPIWTPDGQRLTFESTRNGQRNLYWRRADGSGDIQRLTESQNPQSPESWHPNGRVLAYLEDSAANSYDIWLLPMEGSEETGWIPGEPTAFLSSPSLEIYPRFSPDGNWIAYTSFESGRGEVYVRPYPGPGGKWQISNGGALASAWSPDGKFIYYLNTSRPRTLMRAAYRIADGSFEVDRPEPVNDVAMANIGPTLTWSMHPDGRRIAYLDTVGEQANEQAGRRLHFVFNFFDELERIAPTQER